MAKIIKYVDPECSGGAYSFKIVKNKKKWWQFWIPATRAVRYNVSKDGTGEG